MLNQNLCSQIHLELAADLKQTDKWETGEQQYHSEPKVKRLTEMPVRNGNVIL